MAVISYALSVAAALFIAGFFFLLPDLRKCELGIIPERRFLPEFLPPLLLTVIYAAAAFTNLGDRSAPQSFYKFSSDTVQLELESRQSIDRMMLYTGINTGKYTIEYSPDGENYFYLGELDQNYAELLRWKELVPEESAEAKYIRIISSGNVWLGEVGIYSGDELISFASTGVLTDEQQLIPEESTYLNSSYFDEIYHVRTAVENLNDIYPYEISHPPLGKLIISLGISVFGITPFGWRFMGTLFGVLMLPALYYFLKKLFGGQLVPFCGTALMATDFMHFTQTRIATIDTYGVFFIILMYLFMYLFVSGKSKRPTLCLALSGLFFGIGSACKWTCIYAGAGLGVIWLVYWVFRFVDEKKKEDGDVLTVICQLLLNILLCIVFFVLVPIIVYYCSYYPYGTASGLSGVGMFLTDEYASIVINNQSFMFNYHSAVTATHPYSSRWYQWMLDIRPILYYLQYNDDGTRSSFGAYVNPALCWGGLLSLFVLIYLAVGRKDRKALFILIGYFAQLVPWMFISRITFEYHYFPCTVFLILSLSYCFTILRNCDKKGWICPAMYATFAAALFILFYPTISGETVSNSIQIFKWLPTWPF